MADFRFKKNVCGKRDCKNDRIKKILISSKIVYSMCVSYKDLFKSAKKENRSFSEGTQRFKDECLQVICAMRNSNGGSLVIHTYDKPDRAWSLDGFDQLVNRDCSMMVEDDTLYTENYERKWIVEEGSMVRLPYLLITVEPSASISTYDFKTKVALDGDTVRPKAREIATYLKSVGRKRKMQAQSELKEKFEEGEATNIYESRNVQIRQLSNEHIEEKMRQRTASGTDQPTVSTDIADTTTQPDSDSGSTTQGEVSIEMVIVEMFVELGLLAYLTAFSKLPGGGFFYCGIKEEKDTFETKTGKNIIEGIDLTEQQKQDLENKLQGIIAEKTDWYENVNGGDVKYKKLDSDSILNYIDIKFHPTSQGTDMGQGKRKHVIQVSVNSIFNGMVFYADNSYPDQPNRPIPLSFRFSKKGTEIIIVPVDTINWLISVEKAATLLER
ncbi:uncharacterized protein LOC121377347 isoform X2 [Gigantopelta aegis]|uniref:uncharacterized protein LOC121377347 isoform X2 n=1 Tax=Gigantopelta aegis TaxID=1735272 RepID=UPI001B889866|nr:uncharacterized protein LOC121377347 isoform X2 [Gigantopelta aegis]